MSTSSSSVYKQDKYEKEFSEFLFKRLRNAGGSLQLQYVTQLLSELSYDVRGTVGTSKSDLVKFLNRHRDLFSVNDNVIKTVDSLSNNDGYDSDGSSVEPQPSLPPNITQGKGVVIKIFPEFGFIKAKEPVKTVVYFNAKNFGDKDTNLTDSLYVGVMVYFHAKRKKDEKNGDDTRSKYFATEVWKVDESDMHSSVISQKSRINRDTGLYDPMTLDSEGVIQNVFPNVGFIAVKGDDKNTVFFHKNRVQKYDNIVDLTKVLSKGDIVEFTAHRSTKQDAKARWEATKVWKKSSKIKEDGVCKSDSSQSNHSSATKIDMKSKNNSKEMIKNQHGKICPRSQGAVIKFGQGELADGDASFYFISGCRVTDISWEFAEGDKVLFDAVKIKSAPGWKAVLVWVGEKPDIVLPTCLGDFTEFTDDETDDNLSTYLSHSSNSSVKSGCSSSKSRQVGKKTSILSASSEVKKDIIKEKLHDSSSLYGSQSSLNSSVTSKSSRRSKKEHKKKFPNKSLNAQNQSVPCWGDSPYPAEDSYPNISLSDNNICDSANTHTKIQNEKVQSVSECSGSVGGEKTMSTKKEFCLPLEDRNVGKKENSDSMSHVKDTACVHKFKSVEGKAVKVYSKFAEVKAKKLENIVSFFWNNFYFNGVSVKELELDDLRQVLKVGDTVYFNYFEIVDDSGQNWQKVTLAWKDSRPVKVTEESPEDFIKQSNLSVSTNYKTLCDEEEDEVVSRKYLAAVEDLVSDNLVVKANSADPCSEDDSSTSADCSNASELDNKAASPLDETLSRAIIQILKKDVFPSNLKVDFNCITEEIINVLLGNLDIKKSDKLCQPLSENEKCETSISTCTDCGKILMSNSLNDVNTKNSEAQTIITGEIIAQNIFTEC